MDRDHYRSTKAEVQRAERQTYWQYVENLIEVGEENCEQRPGKQKRFWSFIKALWKDKSGVAPVPRFTGKTRIIGKTAKIPEKP